MRSFWRMPWKQSPPSSNQIKQWTDALARIFPTKIFQSRIEHIVRREDFNSLQLFPANSVRQLCSRPSGPRYFEDLNIAVK